MIIAALLAAVLSVPASAQTAACQRNEMTSAWEKITFGLWLSDYTVPDDARTADLKYAGCSVSQFGQEGRKYVSADGQFTVVALTGAGGDDGATTLVLLRDGAKVILGTWGHHKVFYKGVGIDKVSVPNGGRGAVVKNVFVIPVDWAK
ncbi:MAG: hypothetical protein Q8T11_11970 [Elusimicrobiota bacterium]|nr:hypothetical protein [Elusimicrobiota bacterium]